MPSKSSKPIGFELKHPLKPELERWLIFADRLHEIRNVLIQVSELFTKGRSQRKQLNLSEKDSQLVRALFCFAVVTYIRCFATGRRRGLKISDIRGLSTRDQKTHEDMHMLRNQHFAHPVVNEECASIFIVRPRNMRGVGVVVFNSVLASSSHTDVRRFISLVQKVARHVDRNEQIAGNALTQAIFGKKMKWRDLLRFGTLAINNNV